MTAKKVIFATISLPASVSASLASGYTRIGEGHVDVDTDSLFGRIFGSGSFTPLRLRTDRIESTGAISIKLEIPTDAATATVLALRGLCEEILEAIK